jgi:hypothetical protein
VFARWAYCHLAHAPNPFFASSVFERMVSHICLDYLACLDCNPPTCASHIAGLTDVHHHSQFVLNEMGSHKLFAKMVLNVILLISAFQKTGTGGTWLKP